MIRVRSLKGWKKRGRAYIVTDEEQHRREADSLPSSFVRDRSFVVDPVVEMSPPSNLRNVDEIQGLGELSNVDRVRRTVNDGGRVVPCFG